MIRIKYRLLVLLVLTGWAPAWAAEQLVVKAEFLYPMTGDLAPIKNGVVVCGGDGKIMAVGRAGTVVIPPGARVIEAKVVTPGIIDAHATVGLSGILNSDRHDQEQLEKSAPIQPELRATDAYNGRDPLVRWVRELGVTTVHTGHAPGVLVAGQTMIIKTNVPSITGEADTIRPVAMVAATLGADGLADAKKGKSPGTRSKAVAMLRGEFLKARAYRAKRQHDDPDKHPEPNLRLDVLAEVLDQKIPLLITAHRHHDITAALRLRREFDFELVLDGASEAYLLLDEIKEAGVSVIVHPTMARAYGDRQNMTFTLAAKLAQAGIPFAFQSGYEGYVPKTRVVLFEAGLAAAYGLRPEQALAHCTIRAAELLKIDRRVGSLVVGKDADLALFDGDPLETTTHCTGVIIDGQLVSEESR